jgi:hypothetical protein
MEEVGLGLCGGFVFFFLVGVPWLVLGRVWRLVSVSAVYFFAFLVRKIGHRGAVVGLRVVF